MKKIIFILVLNVLLFAASNAFAGRYWTDNLQDWNLYVNNGVIYLAATNMPSHCSYSRAQIDTNSSNGGFSQQNNKDLYAYLLTASIAGKSMRIVVSSDQSDCTISGAQ